MGELTAEAVVAEPVLEEVVALFFAVEDGGRQRKELMRAVGETAFAAVRTASGF